MELDERKTRQGAQVNVTLGKRIGLNERPLRVGNIVRGRRDLCFTEKNERRSLAIEEYSGGNNTDQDNDGDRCEHNGKPRSAVKLEAIPLKHTLSGEKCDKSTRKDEREGENGDIREVEE